MLFENMIEVIDEEPHGAALNMAIDEVLLHRAQTPLLRIYRWARPALSFGYFGCAAEIGPESESRETVRRWTGGGIVRHGDDLTYSVIVPRTEAFFRLPPLESYGAIHRSLAALIPEATVIREASSRQQPSRFCFISPSQNDLMLGGRKIAGAGQRRTSAGLLHQGSVQADNGGGRAQIAPRFAKAFARNVRARVLAGIELDAAARLAEEKYGTREWLYRR